MASKIRLLLLVLIGLFSLTACSQFERNNGNQIKIIDTIGLREPVGWVNDFEKIFDEGQKSTLNSLASNFEKETSIEICIITVDTSMTSDKDFYDYVVGVGKKWGVGKREKNNGIVIGFSKGYRKIRISNGYGIEKLISDKETKLIMDNFFIVNFKQNKYYEGTFEGTTALMTLLRTKIKK